MSIESFADDTVIEIGQTQAEQKQPEGIDTFDSEEVITDQKIDKDSQVNLLKDGEDNAKVDKKDAEKGKDSSKKEDEEEDDLDNDGKAVDGAKEKEQEEKEASKTNEQKGKTVKIKNGDESIDIPLDATIKVKVKGKNEFVTIDELRADYSGKKAWTQEIEQAKEKTQVAEFKLQKFKEEKTQIASQLEHIAGMLDKEDGDPLEALYYLLDFTGRDVNNYTKRVFDFMEEKVQAMSEMDEVEKELYWTKRKLEANNNNQSAKAERLKQEQAQAELVAKVDKLRESSGVSVQQYVDAHKELVEMGLESESITPEQIVRYSVLKPFAERAEKVAQQFEEDLGDDEMISLITETTSVIQKRPKISDEEALTIAAKMLGYEVETVDDDIEKLNDKLSGQNLNPNGKKNMKVGSNDDPKHIESFDDF